jgi:hypothetical protein
MYLSTSRPWDRTRLRKLRKFRFSDFLVRDADSGSGNIGDKPSSLEWSHSTAEKLVAFQAFVRRNFYERYRPNFSPEEVEEVLSALEGYLNVATCKVVTYHKKESLVALLMWNDLDYNAQLESPSRHVGYWGLDRSVLESEEAHWIKQHWIKQHWIYLLSEGGRLNRPIECSIDHFNENSLKFAKKSGFREHSLRVDIRACQNRGPTCSV